MKIKWLARCIYKLKPKRDPDFIIKEPFTYMHRWYIIPRNNWLNIYWHQYWGPDEDRALHDHPWKSLSLCLNGELFEQIGTYEVEKSRVIYQGDLVYRSETFAHRVSPMAQDGSVVTLFCTWRKVRDWGFYCPQGWKNYKLFTKGADQFEHGKSQKGGCGEI